MDINIFTIIGGIASFFGFVWFYLHTKDYTNADVKKFNEKNKGDLESKKLEILENDMKGGGAPIIDSDVIVFVDYRNRHKKYAIVSILFGISNYSWFFTMF